VGCWRGCDGGFEDFGGALGCYGQAGAGVEGDREGDAVAGDEAAAVGQEEEEGDGCWGLGRGWKV